jgi:hypothetical protein
VVEPTSWDATVVGTTTRRSLHHFYRHDLGLIHKELGMAGWLASTEIDSGRRLELLATVHDRCTETMLQPPKNHALAGVASSAEDAVAEGLAGSGQSDHMHLAHLHLLRALELLAGHL